jgi:hypothetical protein
MAGASQNKSDVEEIFTEFPNLKVAFLLTPNAP